MKYQLLLLNEPINTIYTYSISNMLDYALKVSGVKLSGIRLVEKLYHYLKKVKIPTTSAVEGEASNLVNPKTGFFLARKS